MVNSYKVKHTTQNKNFHKFTVQQNSFSKSSPEKRFSSRHRRFIHQKFGKKTHLLPINLTFKKTLHLVQIPTSPLQELPSLPHPRTLWLLSFQPKSFSNFIYKIFSGHQAIKFFSLTKSLIQILCRKPQIKNLLTILTLYFPAGKIP